MLYIFLLILALAALFFYLRRQSASSHRKKLTRSQENANLIKVLLELDEDSREELFRLYRNEFGDNAARYARKTYQKWKAGTVRPTKQTFRRFLINLPRVMSFDLKCEVVRELREAYCERSNYTVTVSINDWKSTLKPLVEDMIHKGTTAELPAMLNRRLTWLAEDDVTVANAILAESQARESKNTMALLEKEFSNIERVLDNAPRNTKVSHALKFPLGTITANIMKGTEDG